MKHTIFLVLVFISCKANSQEMEGFIVTNSESDVVSTTDKLESIIKEKGLKLFSRIDHSAGAANVDLALNPTTLLIFGNPQVGTKLMQCDQRMGIELPMKILIWSDDSGVTKVGFFDPTEYTKKYDLSDCQEVLNKVKAALNGIVNAAVLN
ncbi:MAG: DUF302 domain-containing protein [Bacteroidota bacterium]